MNIISVDLGIKGAIVLSKDGVNIMYYRMPLTKEVRKSKRRRINIELLTKIIGDGEPDIVSYEDIGLIFGSSKYTAFYMGYQKGILEGICNALNIPILPIKAMSWQQYMFNKYKEIAKYDKVNGNTKESSINIVNHLICKNKIKLYNPSGMEMKELKRTNDGIADAVNILLYTNFMIKKEENEFNYHQY